MSESQLEKSVFKRFFKMTIRTDGEWGGGGTIIQKQTTAISSCCFLLHYTKYKDKSWMTSCITWHHIVWVYSIAVTCTVIHRIIPHCVFKCFLQLHLKQKNEQKRKWKEEGKDNTLALWCHCFYFVERDLTVSFFPHTHTHIRSQARL